MKTRKQMINYICSFNTYPTMNSWNNSNGYSFKVKIPNLPLTAKQKDVLYDAINTDEFYDQIHDVIAQWQYDMKKHGTFSEKKEIGIEISGLSKADIAKKRLQYEKRGYTYDRHGTAIMTMKKTADSPIFQAGFNGRSGGYLVLYKWNGHNLAGTGWSFNRDELEDKEENTDDDIKYIYEVLKDFENLYEQLIIECKHIADNYQVVDEEYQVTQTRKRLVENQ